MKKKLLSLFVAATIFGLFGSLKQQTRFALQAQTQSAQPGQMSEAAFKNIQVLKGIPVDEFMGTMGLFTAALSYCCKDCHTGAGSSNPKWEADPPKKVIARRMMQMVATINWALLAWLSSGPKFGDFCCEDRIFACSIPALPHTECRRP